MRRVFLMIAIVAGLAGAASATAPPNRAQPADAVVLDFPLACTLGHDCWIQHYVDRGPSPAARDYTCGSLTYEGHKGTDIRIADMAAERAGVNVLAAADGKVLRLRDGVADISVRINGLKSVEGTECGNGIVVDHGGGWQTQYCHMAKGSIVVRPGETVKAGQPLGHVGLSGETEFPHLHISVWHNSALVDPFAPDAATGAACGSGRSLWRHTPPYTPRMTINAGFASAPLDNAAVEAGDVARPTGASAYVVAYVRTVGLRAGDQLSLILFGPDGRVLAPSPPVQTATNQDQRVMFVGKRRPAQGWPKGVYRARYVVKAGGQVVLSRDFEAAINPG